MFIVYVCLRLYRPCLCVLRLNGFVRVVCGLLCVVVCLRVCVSLCLCVFGMFVCAVIVIYCVMMYGDCVCFVFVCMRVFTVIVCFVCTVWRDVIRFVFCVAFKVCVCVCCCCIWFDVAWLMSVRACDVLYVV